VKGSINGDELNGGISNLIKPKRAIIREISKGYKIQLTRLKI
jgi:hypothetical protein